MEDRPQDGSKLFLADLHPQTGIADLAKKLERIQLVAAQRHAGKDGLHPCCRPPVRAHFVPLADEDLPARGCFRLDYGTFLR